MRGPQSREEWIETAGLAVAAGALYASGFFALLFLLPLVALLRRRGFSALLVGAGIAVLGVIIVDVVRLSRLPSGPGLPWLVAWNWTLPVGLLVGLVVLGWPIPGVQRTLYRLLVGWAATMVVTVPLYVKIGADGTLHAFLESQFAALGAATEGGDAAQSGAALLADTAVRVLGNTYGVGLLVLLVLNWYLGSYLAHRFSTGVAPPPRLAGFAMPSQAVWVLIASVAAVLLTFLADLGPVEPVAWNVALVSLFLYGVQGIAVGRHLLAHYRVQQGARMLIIIGAIVLVFVPGVNLIVLLGLPGLGVSELWIDYNRFERRR
ncbi:MAG: DUF2232 domain-containing protein [Spirochaetota bacterium]